MIAGVKQRNGVEEPAVRPSCARRHRKTFLSLDIENLTERGLVPPERLDEMRRVAEKFSVALTDDVAGLIDPADPNDPIAAQFVPNAAELIAAPDDRADPIGDERWSPLPGIVHRYPDRVLLKPILVCPVYCRFCFRREQVGKDDGVLPSEALERALDYIRAHPEIWEVIVTGGDPLLLSPRRLSAIVRALDEIQHVQVIRFHSRVPIVDPGRVRPALVAALAAEKAIYVVVHANHPRELTLAVRGAVGRLVRAGIPVLSQSVLLRGINDDATVLETLFRGLVAMRVKPYYLHHPDLARGTGHFRLGIEEGQRLVGALRGRVSGLCQPTYVLDIPGGYGKVPIGESAARPGDEQGRWTVADCDGAEHPYPPISDGKD
jgi:lysine 2,3-aminomutase